MKGSGTALSTAPAANFGALYDIIFIVFLFLMMIGCWNMVPWNGNTKIFKKLGLWKCEENVIGWRELASVLMLGLAKVLNFMLIFETKSLVQKHILLWNLKPTFANFLAESKGKWPKICCIRSGVTRNMIK